MWAKEVAQFVRQNGTYSSVELFTQAFAPSRIYWMGDLDGWRGWENMGEKLRSSQQWSDLLNRGASLVVDGSFEDTFLDSVS